MIEGLRNQIVASFLLLFLTVFPNSTYATEVCRFHQSTSLQTTLKQSGRVIRYSLALKEGPWKAVPFGWHATAILGRDLNKNSKEVQTHGLLFIFPYKGTYQAPAASYIGGSTQPLEFFGYPHLSLGADRISLIEERSDFKLSDFLGGLKIYEFIKDDAPNKELFKEWLEKDRLLGLISIKLNDGCAGFASTLIFDGQKDLLTTANILLEEIKDVVSIVREDIGSLSLSKN